MGGDSSSILLSVVDGFSSGGVERFLWAVIILGSLAIGDLLAGLHIFFFLVFVWIGLGKSSGVLSVLVQTGGNCLMDFLLLDGFSASGFLGNFLWWGRGAKFGGHLWAFFWGLVGQFGLAFSGHLSPTWLAWTQSGQTGQVVGAFLAPPGLAWAQSGQPGLGVWAFLVPTWLALAQSGQHGQGVGAFLALSWLAWAQSGRPGHVVGAFLVPTWLAWAQSGQSGQGVGAILVPTWLACAQSGQLGHWAGAFLVIWMLGFALC